MWNYEQPVNIVFGKNSIKDLSKVISERGYKKGILISDSFFVENGYAINLFEDKSNNLVGIFSNISENPTIKNVDDCSSVIKEIDADFIVALGGGSVIDCAKAASVVSLTNNSIRLYLEKRKPLPDIGIPLIVIPTTAGTGSEVTSVSVLTDGNLNKKTPISSKGFYPKVALIDPSLTYSLSPYITASTGIDVLCHAIEGYWSKNHQPITDCLGVYAASLILEYLESAYFDSNNEKAREKVSEASVVAGLAFNLPKTTVCHACSFPLTTLYNIPHGEACGLTLDYFIKFNSEDKRVKELSKRLGFKNPFDMGNYIYSLKKKINLKLDLKQLNLTDKDIDVLVKESKHPNLKNNPVKVKDKDLNDLYFKLSRG